MKLTSEYLDMDLYRTVIGMGIEGNHLSITCNEYKQAILDHLLQLAKQHPSDILYPLNPVTVVKVRESFATLDASEIQIFCPALQKHLEGDFNFSTLHGIIALTIFIPKAWIPSEQKVEQFNSLNSFKYEVNPGATELETLSYASSDSEDSHAYSFFGNMEGSKDSDETGMHYVY